MSRFPALLLSATLLGALPAAGASTAPDIGPPAREAMQVPRVVLAPVPGTFQFPVAMAQHPHSDDLYVVEKGGTIRAVREGLFFDPAPVLDVSSEVSGGLEQGLLGLAFSPDGDHMYVNFTAANRATRIVEFGFADGAVVPGTRRDVLTVAQPFNNHNGGSLAFGPDGYLYIGMGDGGSGGDPQYNGQRPETLLGSMLRIDPRPDGPAAYGVPADNPFVGHDTARPEAWAYGLRNPWKYSFDRDTGDLWIADVGQNSWEEINLQRASSSGGENYGWNHMEGLVLYSGRPSGAEEPENHQPPIHTYSIAGQVSCAVVGGFVYRGRAIPSLRGHFVYSDWCDGRLRTIREEDGEVVEEVELDVTIPSVTAFGQDHEGELYAISQGGGVFKILPVLEEPGAPTTPRPGPGSQVEELDVVVGEALAVSGAATFAADPVQVGGSPPGSGIAVAPGSGMDLAWGVITQQRHDLLAFDIGVYDMPSTGAISDVVRYDWNLSAHRDGTMVDDVILRAERSVRGGEPGSAEDLFTLMRCAGSVSVCTFIPLTGEFHRDGAQILVPPSVIGLAEGGVVRQAGDGVVAGYQVQGTAVDVGGDRMPIADLTVYAPTVELGIASAGTPDDEIPLTAVAAVAGSGDFSGELTRPDQPGTYRVVARACLGPGSCALAGATVTVG